MAETMTELTGGLCASQRLTLLSVADSVHIYQILGLWCQSGQSVVVPGWGQPLVLGPPAARLLIADAVASDSSGWSQPVDGEGVGADVREVQASGGVQSCRGRFKITCNDNGNYKTARQHILSLFNNLFYCWRLFLYWCHNPVAPKPFPTMATH